MARFLKIMGGGSVLYLKVLKFLHNSTNTSIYLVHAHTRIIIIIGSLGQKNEFRTFGSAMRLFLHKQ